ncbi:uncharacterized protein I206_101956 [Kwoniella pini CBS 10737]|uniref:Uncharacterized protein n=1 Tax=Kwoniella pini CBS 10737 TaxID=1296096 RepID=A0A1B9HV75_9TREE|nr:uncharacterized protein I206_06953 [Kwoniella pini CBS 10737]OCF47175.1 hypothetical protein I206_06953 [Kwoniella pini CBS 10737]
MLYHLANLSATSIADFAVALTRSSLWMESPTCHSEVWWKQNPPTTRPLLSFGDQDPPQMYQTISPFDTQQGLSAAVNPRHDGSRGLPHDIRSLFADDESLESPRFDDTRYYPSQPQSLLYPDDTTILTIPESLGVYDGPLRELPLKRHQGVLPHFVLVDEKAWPTPETSSLVSDLDENPWSFEEWVNDELKDIARVSYKDTLISAEESGSKEESTVSDNAQIVNKSSIAHSLWTNFLSMWTSQWDKVSTVVKDYAKRLTSDNRLNYDETIRDPYKWEKELIAQMNQASPPHGDLLHDTENPPTDDHLQPPTIVRETESTIRQTDTALVAQPKINPILKA